MIVVEHKESGCRYLLLGTGYGLGQTATPSALWGRVLPDREEETHVMVCLCDSAGDLAWCPSNELRVVSINGEAVSGLSEVSSFDDQVSRVNASRSGSGKPAELTCARCDQPLVGPICEACDAD